MSVLVEAISVIVRRETLAEKYPGGVAGYARDCPNRTFCADNYLTRVGFMVPPDVASFMGSLQVKGLSFIEGDMYQDIAVVDQRKGPTGRCDWLSFRQHPRGFSYCWLAGTEPGQMAIPPGWEPNHSMKFALGEEAERSRKYLRHENGLDVFLNLETGREEYVGRQKGQGNAQPITKAQAAAGYGLQSLANRREWNVGDRLHGRWEIYKVLRGGMGVVYVVYDPAFNEPLAVKTFRDEVFDQNPDVARRFVREANTWVDLDAHPNIVRARMVRELGGKPHIFLEYVSGGDLSSWIGTPRLTDDLPRALRFAIQFCDGMTYARSKGIEVHRDVKPQNCLITPDGVLKVTDFGLAKALSRNEHTEGGYGRERGTSQSLNDAVTLLLSERRRDRGGEWSPSLTQTGGAAGTCTHMAPEQFDDAKNVDVRADVYSFGVMLFQMVTGRSPLAGRTWQEWERQHKSQKPEALNSRHPNLNKLVEKCLAKDPEQRFQDFTEVRDALGRIYGEVCGESAPGVVAAVDSNVIELYNKGLSLAALKRYADAIRCWDQVIEADPVYSKAWSNKGMAYAEMGEIDKALSCHDRAIEIAPDNGGLWHSKGTTLNSAGQPREALDCYKRAIELNPRDDRSWYDSGVSNLALGMLEMALDCWGRAIELNPLDNKSWANRGAALIDVGEVEEALRHLTRAMEIDPLDEKAWYNMGTLFANELGDYREALKCFEQARQLGLTAAKSAINYCRQYIR